MDVINTREIASLTWLLLGIVTLSFARPFRDFLKTVYRELFKPKFLSILIISVLYMFMGVLILIPDQLSIARFYFLFFTWLCIGALPSMRKAVEDAEKIRFDRFWDWLKKTFSATTVLTFISGFSSFSLVTEFILVPFSIVLSVILIRSKHKALKIITNIVIIALGAIFIANSGLEILRHPDSFTDSSNISNFYVQPFLSLIFLPFLYILFLLVSYENVFSRIPIFIKDSKIAAYAKSSAFTSFVFDVVALREWFRHITEKKPTNERQVQETLSVAYMRIQRSRYWRKINACGWDIKNARHHLTEFDIKTRQYRCSQIDSNIWMSLSPMVNIGVGTSPLPNNISYYIEGSELEVKTLTLKLNVNIPSDAELAEELFFKCAEKLVAKTLPDTICQSVLVDIENKKQFTTKIRDVRISVASSKFTGTIPDGYDLKITIECVKSS